MEKVFQVISSKRELKKENEAIYLLTKEFPIKEVRKLSGKKCGAWYEEETLGSLEGYELVMKDGNRVFIDAEKDGEYLVLYKLFIQKKNTGLGTKIMEVYKDFSDKQGGTFMVCWAINHSFFQKFAWLSFDGHQTYEYTK